MSIYDLCKDHLPGLEHTSNVGVAQLTIPPKLNVLLQLHDRRCVALVGNRLERREGLLRTYATVNSHRLPLA